MMRCMPLIQFSFRAAIAPGRSRAIRRSAIRACSAATRSTIASPGNSSDSYRWMVCRVPAMSSSRRAFGQALSSTVCHSSSLRMTSACSASSWVKPAASFASRTPSSASSSGSESSTASDSSAAMIGASSPSSLRESGRNRNPLPPSLSIWPSLSSAISASRSGVRLTPSSAASLTSLTPSPGSTSPLRMRASNSSRTCARKVRRSIGIDALLRPRFDLGSGHVLASVCSIQTPERRSQGWMWT